MDLNLTMIFKTVCLVFAINVATTYAADYKFMDYHCGETLTLSPNETVVLGVVNYVSSTTCSVGIRTKAGQRIMFYFTTFSFSAPQWLQLYDGSSTFSSYVSGLYGKQTGYSRNSVYKTSSNNLFVQMRGSYPTTPDFSMVLTSYHTGVCYSREHECNNGRCISTDVQCTGYNTCGDYSDCDFGLSVGAISGIAIGAFFFVIFVSLFIILVRRRRFAQTTTAVTPTPYPGYSTYPAQPSPYGVQTPYPTGQQLPTY